MVARRSCNNLLLIICRDNLYSEHFWLIQAQRLLLKDGNLSHFALPPKPSAMPNITAGLPAQVSNVTFRHGWTFIYQQNTTNNYIHQFNDKWSPFTNHTDHIAWTHGFITWMYVSQMPEIVSEHLNTYRNKWRIRAFTSFLISLVLFISCDSVYSHCRCCSLPCSLLNFNFFETLTLHLLICVSCSLTKASLISFQPFLLSHFHSPFCP